MKRKHIVMVAGLLACSMLAGCGAGDSSRGEAAGQPGTSGEAADGGSSADGSAGSGAGEITFPLDEAWTVEAFAFSNTGQELDKTDRKSVV